MTQVGEITYKVRIDTSSIAGSVKSVESTISNGSNKAAKAASDGGSKVSAGWAAATGAIAGITSTVFSAAANAISSSISGAIKRVDTLNNFPKVMSNLGVSADDAQSAIDKMSNKLLGLPTSLNDAAAAVQRFTSKNGDVGKSTDMFLALNNAILAGGAPMDIQATALEQLSQAYAKGKPDMMEWRSLNSAMPAQLKQVAIAMGYGAEGAEALGEDLRNGKVSMDEFMDTIMRLDKEGVDGFQNFETQARNSTGGIGTILTNLKNRIEQGLGNIIQQIGPEKIGQAIEGLSNIILGVSKAVVGIISFLQDNQWIFWTLVAVIGAITAAMIAYNIATGIAALTTNALILPLTLIIVAIGAIIAIVVLVITHLQQLGEFFNTVFTWIGETVSNVCNAIGQFFQNAWNTIMSIFGGIGQWFQDRWNDITNVFSAVGGWFRDRFNDAWNGITGAISGIGSWFGDRWNDIKNSFSGVFEWFADIGRNIWEGIKSGIGNIAGKMREMFEGAVEGVKRFLGIESPSRLFRNVIGKNIGLGLVAGLDDQMDKAQLALNQMTGGIYATSTIGVDSTIEPFASDYQPAAVGATYNINVEGTFATSPAERRKVADQIVDAINQNNKRRI